jgi:hypothetical protein
VDARSPRLDPSSPLLDLTRDTVFSRIDLVFGGDDDVEEPIAHTVAGLFGPPGRLALDLMRSAAETARRRREEAHP